MALVRGLGGLVLLVVLLVVVGLGVVVGLRVVVLILRVVVLGRRVVVVVVILSVLPELGNTNKRLGSNHRATQAHMVRTYNTKIDFKKSQSPLLQPAGGVAVPPLAVPGHVPAVRVHAGGAPGPPPLVRPARALLEDEAAEAEGEDAGGAHAGAAAAGDGAPLRGGRRGAGNDKDEQHSRSEEEGPAKHCVLISSGELKRTAVEHRVRFVCYVRRIIQGTRVMFARLNH